MLAVISGTPPLRWRWRCIGIFPVGILSVLCAASESVPADFGACGVQNLDFFSKKCSHTFAFAPNFSKPDLDYSEYYSL